LHAQTTLYVNGNIPFWQPEISPTVSSVEQVVRGGVMSAVWRYFKISDDKIIDNRKWVI